MSAHENTKIVQEAYAAFGRGDVKSILDGLSDDVDWHAIVGASDKVPTSGRRVGKPAVTKFFTDLGGAVDFQQFEPREFIAEGDKVVTLGRYTGTSKTTQRQFSSDWVMVFTVRNGKIVHFREFADVAAINAAFA
jgi:ketosteroid isomerase-like protein